MKSTWTHQSLIFQRSILYVWWSGNLLFLIAWHWFRCSNWLLYCLLTTFYPNVTFACALRERSSWMIRIRIIWIVVHVIYHTNWWILVQSGSVSSFDAPWSKWSWIVNPDLNLSKGMHPYSLKVFDWSIWKLSFLSLKILESDRFNLYKPGMIFNTLIPIKKYCHLLQDYNCQL